MASALRTTPFLLAFMIGIAASSEGCGARTTLGLAEQQSTGGGGAATGSGTQTSSVSGSGGAGGGPMGCGGIEDCDDGDLCTHDACLMDGSCEHAARDDDGDGFGPIDCGGSDCDDQDPSVSPAEPEVCFDFKDNDCNGLGDCGDPLCTSEPGCCEPSPGGESCSNGLDDDCDMLIDCADPDCGGSMDCTCGSPLPGKVACWSMNEIVGGISHESIAGLDGSWLGSPMPTPGVVSGALSFAGFDDHVSVKDAPALDFGTGDFSVSLYVKSTSVDLVVLMDKRVEESGPVQGWVVFIYEGSIGFQIADGVHANFPTSAFIADGVWHHIAVTVDRDKSDGLHIYRDKSLIAAFNPTGYQGSVSNSMPLVLGRRSDSSNPGWLSGALDQIELFNRALSSEEVQGL